MSTAARSVAVRWFAALADRTGCTDETVTIDRGTDVAALWQALVARHPALAEVGYRPLVACDLEYADWRCSLDDVDEVAFLPPVSGG